MLCLKNRFVIFNMNFELHNGLANFGTKFGIFWQKFCEIDCKVFSITVLCTRRRSVHCFFKPSQLRDQILKACSARASEATVMNNSLYRSMCKRIFRWFFFSQRNKSAEVSQNCGCSVVFGIL